MNLEKKLQSAGIIITKKLSVLEVNKISAIISDKIYKTFPEHSINKSNLFIELSKVNMFLAKFNDNSAAKYYSDYDIIFFEETIDFRQMETAAIHEALHFIQAVKGKNGKLKRLGLYSFESFKPNALALNEASVQLMASQISNSKADSVKYYGLEFTTFSPNYYPIECALVNQIAYFTGTYPLYHSTLYSDDIFKNTFIMKSNEKAYKTICSNLNLIVKYQENIHKETVFLTNQSNEKKIKISTEIIETLKNEIRNLALQTQEIIIKNCANADLELVKDKKSIQEFKTKISCLKNYMLTTEDYNFYNNFCYEMTQKLNRKIELINKYGILMQYKEIRQDLSLIEIKNDKLKLLKTVIAKLQSLLHLNSLNENYINEKK